MSRLTPSSARDVDRGRTGGQEPASSYLSAALLLVIGTLLGCGGAFRAIGAAPITDATWIAAGAVGAAYAGWSMLASIRKGRIGVDAIAVLAVVGAILVGEYLAAAVISLMVTSGRALEAWAAGRARRDLHSLLARAPRVARRYDAVAGLASVPVGDLVPGDRLLIGAGELVPTDGVLGSDAILDEAALTGEALPVDRCTGERVRSGVANAGPPFDMLVTASADESTYAGIVRLVAEAESSQAPFVRLADRYALWFLPVALGGAAIAWIVAGAERAVAVLVVATPCPLILAAPVALVAGLSQAARRGVVIKGGAVLERLARCTTVLIDKTGTLTSAHPALVSVEQATDLPPEEMLRLAGSLDRASHHVLARAVVQAAVDRGCELVLPQDVEEEPGRGIRGIVDGRRVALGKGEWAGVVGSPAWSKSARRQARLDGALTVFVSVDDEPVGVFILDDPIRPDAARTIRALRHSGVVRVVMVTGDRSEVAETVGAAIGVDEVFAERSPSDKLDIVRAERRMAPTVMVGDGINDAPALALADVGVAMGAGGATASSETADVVLTVDRLDRVGDARRIARRARRIATQSVVVGMAMSLGAMALAGAGFVPPVLGAFLQEGIDVAVILNALRSLRPDPAETRLSEPDMAITRRFRAEHLVIRDQINQLRAAADCLGKRDADETMTRVRGVHRLLVEEILPHEQAEEAVLYPALDRVLGGSDPTGTMSRAHLEIAHQTRRLGQLLDEIGADPPDEEDIAELRRALYGLHAVLRLHTEQEEESYLSLAGDEHGSGVPLPDPPGGPPERVSEAVPSVVGQAARHSASPTAGGIRR